MRFVNNISPACFDNTQQLSALLVKMFYFRSAVPDHPMADFFRDPLTRNSGYVTAPTLFCNLKLCLVVVKTALFIACFVVLYGESQAFCNGNSDCSGSQVCCNYEECRDSCVGYDCVYHSDCGGVNEYCCDYTCQDPPGLAAWIIVLIVLSVLGITTTIVVVLLWQLYTRCNS
jgi:hypothetical protein